MKKWFVLFLYSVLVFGQEAKEYVPWYTGPVLTPFPLCLESGKVQFQPYLEIKDSYGRYSDSGKNRSIPTIFSAKPSLLLRTGICSFFDVSFWTKAMYRHQKGHGVIRYQDTPVQMGFQLCSDKRASSFPSVRFTISEIFPTGKYERLCPSRARIDAGGEGAYRTACSLIFSKTVYWMSLHPIRWIIYATGSIPSHVRVHGFHYYGGGYKTRGTVKPYYGIEQGGSMECSLSQKWVLACEYLYEHKTKTTFSGHPGFTSTGQKAHNERKDAYLLTLCPLVEYNFTPEFGLVGEACFSVLGKNTTSFVSGIFSLIYIW